MPLAWQTGIVVYRNHIPVIISKSLFIKLDKISLSVHMDEKNIPRKTYKRTKRELAYVKDLLVLEGSKISEKVIKSGNRTYIFRTLHLLFKQNRVLL